MFVARVRRLAAVAACILAGPALAQDSYPSRPITLLVPFAAGGASDVIARLAADQVAIALGGRIVNENVAGAGGTIALSRLARAESDGYTLGIGNAGTNAAGYTIYPDLKYTQDNFVAVGLVARTSAILAVRKDFPAATLMEFVDYARKNPGKVTLGHAGNGSSNFIVCKTFIQAAKVDVTLVAYRGAAPALQDLLGGTIDGVCDNASSISPSIEAKAVRGLAVAAPTRLPNLPDLPTAPEAGLPEFIAQGWNALFAPKGTSPAVLAKLNAALRTAVAGERLQKRMHELGATPPKPDEMAPEVTEKLVRDDIAKMRALLAGVVAN